MIFYIYRRFVICALIALGASVAQYGGAFLALGAVGICAGLFLFDKK